MGSIFSYISFKSYRVFASRKLERLIAQHEIDLLHIHTIPDAIMALNVANIPKIETEHSSGFLDAIEAQRAVSFFQRTLDRAQYVIGPSQELVDTFIRIGIKAEKTAFIPNGVDPDKFNPSVSGDDIREKYKISPTEQIILCPRRLEKKNGVEYLIEAIPDVIDRAPASKFLIVGPDFGEMDALKNRTLELGIEGKVIFTGNVQNSQMPQFYAAADVVVLPSLKEATSIAALEGMATAKALVATNVGGLPYLVINEKTGLLVPPRDPQELAKAIKRILSDPSMRMYMGKNGRARVEQEFSWQQVALKTQEVYDKVIASSQ
jgi:glycosyltransferase involved in cell wall biosynthesis